MFDALLEFLCIPCLALNVEPLNLDFSLLQQLHELRLEQEVELFEFKALVEHREVDLIAHGDEAQHTVLLLRYESFVVFVLTLLDQLCQEELSLGLLDFLRVGFEDDTEVVVVLLVSLADFNHRLERSLAVVQQLHLRAHLQFFLHKHVLEMRAFRHGSHQRLECFAKDLVELLLVASKGGDLLEACYHRVGALELFKDVREHACVVLLGHQPEECDPVVILI